MFDGPESFPQEFAFVFDIPSKTGLNLSPLIVRGLDGSSNQYVEPDFLLFDLARGDKYGFKAVQEREGVSIKKGDSFFEVYERVAELMTADPKLELIRDFEFTLRTLG